MKGANGKTEMLKKTVYTIGHSTRSFEEFIELLRAFKVSLLVDIRNYPGSKRYPYFNKEALEISLPEHGLKYLHLKSLGGRRKPNADSKNTAWRNSAFRGYADYMQTAEFKSAIEELEHLATGDTTAYMCSEAVWWRCHRALVSDYLKTRGWNVLHILSLRKAEEHPYTSPAKVINQQLTYYEIKTDKQLGMDFE